MRNKIVSLLKKITICAIALLLILALFVIEKEIGITHVLNKYSAKILGESTHQSIPEKEYVFLKDVLENYYQLNTDTSLSKKDEFFRKNFSSDLYKKHQYRITDTFAGLLKNNVIQDIQIKSVAYDVTKQEYAIIFSMKQIKQDIESLRINIELFVKVESSDKFQYFVSSWQEKPIYSSETRNLSFALNEISPTSIEVPCRVKNVSTQSKDSNIEYKVLSNYKTVVFNTNSDFNDEVLFQINCEKTKFDITLLPNLSSSTVFASLYESDGKLIQRPLTQQEKTNLSIRNQLREWGLVETK